MGTPAKVRRAEIHVSQIQAACQSWATSDGFRVFGEPDGQGGELVQIEMLNPLPDDLSMIVGDALHCLRHSLDNLAFSLALANKQTWTAKQDEEVFFPIHDHRVTERTKGDPVMSRASRMTSRPGPGPDTVGSRSASTVVRSRRRRTGTGTGSILAAASAATNAGVVLGGEMWTGDLLTDTRAWRKIRAAGVSGKAHAATTPDEPT